MAAPVARKDGEFTGLVLDGAFRFERRVGSGAMGDVYFALDLHDGAPLAVKVIKPGKALDPTYIARFAREARALEMLDSPHVIAVADYGAMRLTTNRAALLRCRGKDLELNVARQPVAADETLFIAMQWVEAETVQAWMQRGTGAAGESLAEIALGVLDALAVAHRAGLVHRDVKPSNILIAQRDGILHPWLIDFGIVKSVEGGLGEDLTMGQIAGTPHFFSPETARGEPVTEAVDLWALGVLLYYAATGAYPTEATVLARVILEIATTPPRRLTLAACKRPLSPRFIAFVNSLIEFDPGRRTKDAATAREALAACPEAAHLSDVGSTLQFRVAPRDAPAPAAPSLQFDDDIDVPTVRGKALPEGQAELPIVHTLALPADGAPAVDAAARRPDGLWRAGRSVTKIQLSAGTASRAAQAQGRSNHWIVWGIGAGVVVGLAVAWWVLSR